MDGVDKCFPGDFLQGAATCAQVPGGYNMTSFAALLKAGQGMDRQEGSLCDPKVSSAPPLQPQSHACTHLPASRGF